MTGRLRRAGRSVLDLWSYAALTGRWWFVFALVLLGIAVLLAATANAVVGPTVYVLF